MKSNIILINGYSFSLDDVIVVEEIKEVTLKANLEDKITSKFFTVYLNGGYNLSLSQNMKEGSTLNSVIDLLYYAIYKRELKWGDVDVSLLDTSVIYVTFKRP